MAELSGIHKDRKRFIAHSMSFVRVEAVAEDIYSESIKFGKMLRSAQIGSR